MATAQWRLVYGGAVMGPFPAPEQTEPIVEGLRNAWAAGEAVTGVVTVQVSSGDGWKTHEYIDFTEEDAA
jgi:hypothetical protein